MSNPYDLGDKKKTSVLGPTLKFKGELTANEDLLIQGQIEGSINHTSNLTVGEEGKLKADIKAAFIAVEGQVEGDLQGSKSVVIKETANVQGNIYSPTVTLREGSTFNGKIDMSGKERPQAESPGAESEEPALPERSSRKAELEQKPAASQKKRSAGGA